MEMNNTELARVEHAVVDSQEWLAELTESQLALVGGGIGEVIVA